MRRRRTLIATSVVLMLFGVCMRWTSEQPLTLIEHDFVGMWSVTHIYRDLSTVEGTLPPITERDWVGIRLHADRTALLFDCVGSDRRPDLRVTSARWHIEDDVLVIERDNTLRLLPYSGGDSFALWFHMTLDFVRSYLSRLFDNSLPVAELTVGHVEGINVVTMTWTLDSTAADSVCDVFTRTPADHQTLADYEGYVPLAEEDGVKEFVLRSLDRFE